MNSQIIRIAAHGHDFFLRYPTAVAGLELTVAGRDVPATFHFVHELLMKEQSEHATATATARGATQTVAELGKRLRHTASTLTRSVNAILDLLGRGAEEVPTTTSPDFVSNLETLAENLAKVSDILAANPALQTAHTQFLADLAAYKAESSQIGATKTTADTEKSQFFSAVETYEPVIAALHALIQRYLAATDANLLAEYRKGLAYGTKKAVESAAGTENGGENLAGGAH